jgi:hypothetical protein
MTGEVTVKYIRAQRIKWWGILNRMEKNINSEERYETEQHRNAIQRTSKK